MAIQGVDTKCYILALFIRDDGERFLLGSGYYEFKDEQMHFSANTIENDTISVQGNDGYLLAGQVRRPGSQEFNGFVGDGTVDKSMVEQKRRDFFSFFRKNFFYKVVYVFPNGTAIQRKRGFLVDDPTVQELYQIFPQYHVALNFEDVNYYSYAEDDDGQEIYAKVAEIQLTASAATGGLIWDNYGVVWEDVDYTWSSAPGGTSFVILNQLDMRAKIKDLVIQGDTSQQTYSGKNLLNVPNGTSSRNNITLDVTDGVLRVHNTGTTSYVAFGIDNNLRNANYAPYVTWNNMTLSAGTYAISTTYVSGSTDTTGGAGNYLRLQVYSRAVGDTGLFSSVEASVEINNTNGSATFALSESKEIIIVVYEYGSNKTIDISFKAQLEKGSATTYEPYVGGTASPNPDYPQDIQVVTGEQTVKVQGKNLFDISKVISNDGASGKVINNGDGTLFVKTPTSSSSVAALTPNKLSDYCPTLKDGDTAVFSATTTGSQNFIYLYGTGANVAWNSGQSRTVTQAMLDAMVLWYASGLDTSATISNIQVELGSTATAYESYQSQSYMIDLGSTELCKIGNYQDYIYKSGDDWYVHKAIGKVVFDGSESYTARASQATNYFGVYTSSKVFGKTAGYMPTDQYMNNNFQQNPTPDVVEANFICGTMYASYFSIPKTIASDTAAFQNWMSSHNTNVYAVLATPTDTKITDSTLIDELNALGSSRLFVGENNVLVSSTGSNLPAPVQFKYVSAYSVTGAEWEEGGPSGPTTVSVDSIAQVFPVWEVRGPAVNPQLSILTTGTTVTYNGTVTSSQVLSIDMFNKTATLNGTSVVGNVSGDWVCFDPGTNRVVYTTGNADALPSTIKWQEIVG